MFTAILFCLQLAVAATPSPEPTNVRIAFDRWVAAFNSGDAGNVAAFWKTYDPQRVFDPDAYRRFHSITGDIEIVEVRASDCCDLFATLRQSANNQLLQLHLSLDPGSRHVDQFDLKTGSAQRAPLSINDAFSGAVLIAYDGKERFAAAYGLANRERHQPNTVETRFRIGSMNKMFTAVAIMQLVQRGALDLNRPFGRYVKDYPNKDASSKVTIAELLDHTGGTGDIFGPDCDANKSRLRTLDDYERFYGGQSLRFTPGSRFEYSNFGFIILGLVIERVSGEDYYQYVHKHIFAPSNMPNTDSPPETAMSPSVSIGYTKNDSGVWESNTGELPWRGTPAGGGFSTVRDLLHFANALTDHRLLDAAHTNALITPRISTPNGRRYGLGFSLWTVAGHSCFGHDGGSPGMNGALRICPTSHLTVVALANIDPPAAEDVANHALALNP